MCSAGGRGVCILSMERRGVRRRHIAGAVRGVPTRDAAVLVCPCPQKDASICRFVLGDVSRMVEDCPVCLHSRWNVSSGMTQPSGSF